ncbi:MAG: glycosyltransferase family 4 protein [Anaerolineae bacterium]
MSRKRPEMIVKEGHQQWETADFRGAARTPLRVAYFSPLPPAPSGIADYSAALLPYLAEYADLTLFTAEPDRVAPRLTQQFDVRPLASYPACRFEFDVALYQMGNSAQHEAMYPYLLRYPGVVVLHDYSLHHFLTYRTVGQGNMPGYSRELGFVLGGKGAALVYEIRRGRQAPPLFELPLNDRLLSASLGVMSHSQYAAERLRRQRPDRPVQRIPPMIEPQKGRHRRHELNWPDEAIIFASLGQVTAAKQVDMALRAFQRLRQTIPNAYYLVVGEQFHDVDLHTLAHELGVAEYVHFTGHVADLPTFIDWIYTADIVINLRHPTVGETSATALRALAAARPLIVFDQGWYSEIPDSACAKMPPMDDAALLGVMRQLALEPPRRQQMGQSGKTYVTRHCHPQKVAGETIRFLHTTQHSIKEKYA